MEGFFLYQFCDFGLQAQERNYFAPEFGCGLDKDFPVCLERGLDVTALEIRVRRQVKQSKRSECSLCRVVGGILPDYLGWFGRVRCWLCCLSRGLAPKYATEVAVLAEIDGVHEGKPDTVESKA